MKTKLFALIAFSIFNFQFSMSEAQAQRSNSQDMQNRRAEMVEQRAERLAKDFELKGDKKEKFVSLYKDYQKELMGTQQQERQRFDRNGEGNNDKKMTDEQAQKMLDNYFDRQEQQIKRQQERLEVERKYLAKFQELLTTPQLAKLFVQQRNMQRNQQRPGGPQGGYGPRGGQGQRQGGFGGRPEGDFGGDF